MIEYSEVSWSDGSCRGLDPALFHPERGVSPTGAKAVCADCPIKEACLEWGLAHERLGIWGGTSERERRALRRQRGIVCTIPTLHEVQGCGTQAGYQRHLRLGEPTCRACRHANVQRRLAKRHAS